MSRDGRNEEIGGQAQRRVDLTLAANTATQIDRTFVPQLLSIALIVALFEPRFDAPVMWWWAFAGVLNLVRGAVFNHAHKRSLRNGQTRSWPGFLNTLFSASFGVQWGSLVLIADRFGTVEDRALAVVIALAAMSLSAVVSAGSRSMYLTAVVGNVLTIGIGWAISGRLTVMLAGLVIVYFFVAAYLHDTVHRMIRANTESVYRNEVLATKLEAMLAFEDPMTKLRNRDGLMAWFDEASYGEPVRRVAVAVGNVERLSSINELFGAAQGDCVLAAIGERLLRTTTPTSMACRLAGDEFAVVEILYDSSTSIAGVEQRLIGAVREGVEIDGELLNISMSTASQVGASTDFEQLLVAASAVVRAERARRAPTLSGSTGPLAERRELIEDLRVALTDRSMAAWFQPIIECDRSGIVAWEALARWTHPSRGQISPGEFLGLVELGRLTDEFTDRIVDDSIRFSATLLAMGCEQSAAIHVNLTAEQAERPDIVDSVTAALARHGVASKYLTVEITEQEVPDLGARLTDNLGRFEAVGIGISIDDFGTGYSSLSHLFDIRPAELKIDKKFVDGLPGDATSAGLVRGVLGLAAGMGLSTVAEGVESSEQADFLRRNGCGAFQGFLEAPAMPPDQALRFLADRNLHAQRRGDDQRRTSLTLGV